MNETNLQNAIASWLKVIYPAMMDVAKIDITTRIKGQLILLWHMQEVGRPKTPFIMGRISAVTKPGRDSFEPPLYSGGHVSQKHHGDRNFMLYLEYFGNDALAQLSKVTTACDDTKTIDTLRAGGCTVIRPGSVVEAHAYLGTIPEDRAMLDIEMRTYEDETQTDLITIVEHANINGEVDGVAVEEISV